MTLSRLATNESKHERKDEPANNTADPAHFVTVSELDGDWSLYDWPTTGRIIVLAEPATVLAVTELWSEPGWREMAIAPFGELTVQYRRPNEFRHPLRVPWQGAWPSVTEIAHVAARKTGLNSWYETPPAHGRRRVP